MAGAMRKMAVYLGLVEDDRYDNPGYDPDDEFEPEPEPERSRERIAGSSPFRIKRPYRTNRYELPSLRHQENPSQCRLKTDVLRESPPWRPSHPNARIWRRTPP